MNVTRLRFKSVLFDLDGTLIDSRAGIENSLCAAAAEYGVALNRANIRSQIGPPIREILRRLLPAADITMVDDISSSYRRIYDGGGCLPTQLFPGIREVLAELRQLGTRLFIVTNKPTIPAALLVKHLSLEQDFEAIATPDDPVSPFSAKPAAVADLINAKQIDSSSACVIGDAVDDAHAAFANNVAFIAAAYGYGEVDKQREYPITHVASAPAQLTRFLTFTDEN